MYTFAQLCFRVFQHNYYNDNLGVCIVCTTTACVILHDECMHSLHTLLQYCEISIRSPGMYVMDGISHAV